MGSPKFSIRVLMIILVTIISLPLIVPQIATSSTAQTQAGNRIPLSINMPLSKGYVNGKIYYFLATDSSDSKIATAITNSTGFKVNFPPNLAEVPISSREQGYDFLNGVKGEGSFGFQIPVASAVPGENSYSPLVQLNLVRWHPNATPLVLTSAAEIITAQKNQQLTIINTNIIINSPLVK
jgi:hypothetical protein